VTVDQFRAVPATPTAVSTNSPGEAYQPFGLRRLHHPALALRHVHQIERFLGQEERQSRTLAAGRRETM
jgi:hypothetical protein